MHDGNEGTGRRAGGEERRPDTDPREAVPVERRASEPTADGGRRERRGPSSWVNGQSALYVLVLGVVCVPLSSLTSFWWILPVLGAIVPIALAALNRHRLAPGNFDDGKLKERELLHALTERGDLTPAAAAMRTSLTVEEASKMLEGLARKGHLQPQVGDGVLSYALPERDRQATPDAALPPPDKPSAAERESAGAPQRLEDPLSERELEVLRLLASGKTNSEAARDLFVSVGTVKSHSGNIYRKLGARNRAEAVARARRLGLLS